jgi:hypothetical protein
MEWDAVLFDKQLQIQGNQLLLTSAINQPSWSNIFLWYLGSANRHILEDISLHIHSRTIVYSTNLLTSVQCRSDYRVINAYGAVARMEVRWVKYIKGENLSQSQILLHKSRSNKDFRGLNVANNTGNMTGPYRILRYQNMFTLFQKCASVP